VWTDERGVVHAASDPGEVPAAQREQAIKNAEGGSHKVTISNEFEQPVPAAPAAGGTSSGGTGLDVEPDVTPQRHDADEPQPKKKLDPKHLPPPEPGFEWNCPTNPEGGPPKCEQFEKKSSKKARRAEAREKAKKDLGVQPGDEFDPDVAKKVNERAEHEYKKTTKTPDADESQGSEAGDEEAEPGDD
jgi:hypothetical protein